MKETRDVKPLSDNPEKGIMKEADRKEGGLDMSIYLNPANDGFVTARKNPNYVDKSMLIRFTNYCLDTGNSFLCVTRPRRFGKSMALHMLTAYYSMGCESRELFKGLKIENDPSFEEHLNKHYVIRFDVAGALTEFNTKRNPILAFEHELVQKLKEDFDIHSSAERLCSLVKEVYSKKHLKFIILIDEWDAVFRDKKDDRELCESYMEFLRSLFKDINASACFELVYMTGILPIAKYNTQSALNMFREYNMLHPGRLVEFFGFTEDDVDVLCEKNNVDREMMKKWYDGYHYGELSLYNPFSVDKAIRRKHFSDYWKATSSVEAVKEYMDYDGGALKEDIIQMISGGKIKFNPNRFQNNINEINSKDAALTMLVHLGYLGYDPDTSECYIPNLEIRNEFENAIDELSDWKDVQGPLSVSAKLAEKTFQSDTAFIDKTFDEFHRLYADTYTKNLEAVLGLMTRLLYYRLEDDYERTDEVVNVIGRADIIFRPKKKGLPALIIELKANDTPENAIRQIEEMGYLSFLKSFKGKAYLLGIAYDGKSLKHKSAIKIVEV